MSINISKFTNSDYGIGITGKLNRVDINNPYGADNLVYISIYQKKNDTFYNDIVKCINDSRTDNKNLVIDKVVDMLLKLL